MENGKWRITFPQKERHLLHLNIHSPSSILHWKHKNHRKSVVFMFLLDLLDRNLLKQLARAATGALCTVVHACHRIIRILLTADLEDGRVTLLFTDEEFRYGFLRRAFTAGHEQYAEHLECVARCQTE